MQISSLTTNLDNPVQSSHIHPHLHGFCRQHNDQLHPTICGKDEVFHADEHSRGQGFLGSRDKDSWESLSPNVPGILVAHRVHNPLSDNSYFEKIAPSSPCSCPRVHALHLKRNNSCIYI